MKSEMETNRRSFKPPFLMLAVLGAHVVAAGIFMTMSGCQTRQVASEEVGPAPAPVLPPSAVATPAPVVTPRPVIRPPAPVERVTDTTDAATYTVQKGDSLSKIAAKAGVSTAELAELNNITNRNSIRIGQRLLLPAHARALPAAAAAPASKPSAPAAAKPAAGPASDSGQTHTVQGGDTLGKLASRYGTTVSAFREVNGLKSDVIRIGQKLKVPTAGRATANAAKETPAAPAAPAPATATAPEAAAPAAEVTPPPAPEAAPVMIPVVETPPVPATTGDGSAATDEAPFPYTVKEGDTLDSIAIKFSARKDVIMRLNNIASESALSPGQRLLIPWQ